MSAPFDNYRNQTTHKINQNNLSVSVCLCLFVSLCVCMCALFSIVTFCFISLFWLQSFDLTHLNAILNLVFWHLYIFYDKLFILLSYFYFISLSLFMLVPLFWQKCLTRVLDWIEKSRPGWNVWLKNLITFPNQYM